MTGRIDKVVEAVIKPCIFPSTKINSSKGQAFFYFKSIVFSYSD